MHYTLINKYQYCTASKRTRQLAGKSLLEYINPCKYNDTVSNVNRLCYSKSKKLQGHKPLNIRKIYSSSLLSQPLEIFFLIFKLNLPLLNLILLIVLYALDLENRLSLAFLQHAFHVPEGHCLLVVLASLGFPAFLTQPLKICLSFKKNVSRLFIAGPAFLGVMKILHEVSAEPLLLSLQAQQHYTSQSFCSFRDVFSSIIHR